MIRLDTVNRSLTLFLGGAQVTAPLQIVVSYSDQTSATYLGSTQLANSNGTTAVTICSAPVASVIRDIDMVTVLNTDSASQVVTIQLLDTATTYKIISVTLLVGDKLTYTHGSAWQVVNNAGNIKYTVLATTGVDSFSGGSTGLTPATATTGVVTLGGTLAVANGGTGVTSSTGTTNVVLSNSPTIATPTLTSPIITGSTPQTTVYTSGSGTYTTPANCRWLDVRMVGGGGGGGGAGAGSGGIFNGQPGSAGGNTTLGSSFLTCNGGAGGTANGGSTVGGGSATGGDVNLTGGNGGSGAAFTGVNFAGNGGSTPFGSTAAQSIDGIANTGAGGSGMLGNTIFSGGGGGGGGYLEETITSPSATYSYAVGAGGAGGAIGTAYGSSVAGAGGSGIIIITACF